MLTQPLDYSPFFFASFSLSLHSNVLRNCPILLFRENFPTFRRGEIKIWSKSYSHLYGFLQRCYNYTFRAGYHKLFTTIVDIQAKEWTNEKLNIFLQCSVHESIRRNDSTVDKLAIGWPFRGKPDIRLSYTCDCTRVPLTWRSPGAREVDLTFSDRTTTICGRCGVYGHELAHSA